MNTGPREKHKLGVLLVHGIGRQRSGETLVAWGDALLKTISLATNKKVKASISDARVADSNSDSSSEGILQLRYGETNETWKLAECWWADSFPPPTYRELVSWSLMALPWTLVLFIARRSWGSQLSTPLNRLGDKILLAGKMLIAFAIAPVLVLALFLALVLGLLPIPTLRTTILNAQINLTGTIGDCLAFVESPIRAALIRTRIVEALRRLRPNCEKIIILAHSQGAAVTMDALGGLVPFNETVVPDKKAGDEAPKDIKVSKEVETLVTFGAGTNQLAALRVLSGSVSDESAKQPEERIRQTVWLGIGGLFGLAVLSGWLWAEVSLGLTSIAAVGIAVLLWFCVMLLLGLIAWTYSFLVELISEGFWKKVVQGIAVVAFVAVLAVIVLTQLYADRWNAPILTVSLAFIPTIFVVASVKILLSEKVKTQFEKAIQKPWCVETWFDLYATSDPVPNGPTRATDAKQPISIRIWNQGSFLRDHTTYWENLDGFVLRILRACCEAAESKWKHFLPEITPATRSEGDNRAIWRIVCMRLANSAMLTALLVGGGFLLCIENQRLQSFHTTGSWEATLPRGPINLLANKVPGADAPTIELAVLGIMITLAVWLAASVIRIVWLSQMRSEQALSLQSKLPPEPGQLPLFATSAILFILLAAFALIANGIGTRAELFKFLKETAGLSLGFTIILAIAFVVVATKLYSRESQALENS